MEKQSWYDWRSKGLGSSDAPIIMRVSPWSTPYQLWQLKTGLVAREDKTNFAMNRGNELEPKARALYEIEYNMDMPATLCEHAEFPFLRASLDGYNAAAKVVIEIKYSGRADYENAKQGIVPEKYYPQMQHQLLVTGANRVDFVSFDGNAIVVVPVLPDLNYCKLLQKELTAFWKCVQDREPPELCDRDYKRVAKGTKLYTDLLAWKEADLEAKRAEEKAAMLKKALLKDLGEEPRIRCGEFRIAKITKAGSVDYKVIPELKNVDLNLYRKAATTYYKLSATKEDEADDNN